MTEQNPYLSDVSADELAALSAQYAGKHIVVKASGGLFTDGKEKIRRNVARQLLGLASLGARIVFIHGGGAQINAAMREADLDTMYSEDTNQRITRTKQEFDLIHSALNANNNDLYTIFTQPAQNHVDVTSGAAAAFGFRAVRDETKKYGQNHFTGRPVEPSDLSLLTDLGDLEKGHVFILSPICGGLTGISQLYNVNADTLAGFAFRATQSPLLVFQTRAKGLPLNGSEASDIQGDIAAGCIQDYLPQAQDGNKVEWAAVQACAKTMGDEAQIHAFSFKDTGNDLIRAALGEVVGARVTLAGPRPNA